MENKSKSTLEEEFNKFFQEPQLQTSHQQSRGTLRTYTLYAAFCEGLHDPGDGPKYYATLKEVRRAHQGCDSVGCSLVKSIVLVPTKEQMVKWLNDGRVTHYLVRDENLNEKPHANRMKREHAEEQASPPSPK
jgi:hypothetical protein